MVKEHNQNGIEEKNIEIIEASNHSKNINKEIRKEFVEHIHNKQTRKKGFNRANNFKTNKLRKLRTQLYKKFKKFIYHKQETYENNCGSSCDFICPICLEMFLTPCPTSCGHMFCFRCIDESLIRKGTCPSCRNYIRNQEFIESKPFSQMCHYFWMTSKQKDQYLQKVQKNQQWLKKRRIDENNLKINDFIDVRDTQHIWCKAKIMNTFENNGRIDILVHFEGWNEIYDEVINSKSQRLAPYNFFSERNDIPRYKLNSNEDNMSSRIDYREPEVNQQRFSSENFALLQFPNMFQFDIENRPPLFHQFFRRRIRPNNQIFEPQPIFTNLRPLRILRQQRLQQNEYQNLHLISNSELSPEQQGDLQYGQEYQLDIMGSLLNHSSDQLEEDSEQAQEMPDQIYQDGQDQQNNEQQSNAQQNHAQQNNAEERQEPNPLADFEECIARVDEQINLGNQQQHNQNNSIYFFQASEENDGNSEINEQNRNQNEIININSQNQNNIGINRQLEQRISDSESSEQLDKCVEKYFKRASQTMRKT